MLIMTIKELKNKYAQENGYENWYDYLNHCKSHGFDESEIGYDDLIKFCCKYHVEQSQKRARIIDDPNSYTGNTGSEYPPDQIIKFNYSLENIK